MKRNELEGVGGSGAGQNQVVIRPFDERDLGELVRVYQSAFAEPPWDECKKCEVCSKGYGVAQSAQGVCSSCGNGLVDFWSAAQIEADLREAQAEPRSFVLVAEADEGLVGFTWGYALPIKKFPFLAGRVSDAIYMDEIAVSGDSRLRGIGRQLGRRFLEETTRLEATCAVLRTDVRNVASMTLFERLGFKPVRDDEGRELYDPQFSFRIYLTTDGRYGQ